jgi:putative Mn2+ efflux pump MntP
MSNKQQGSIIAGLIFITIGILFLLNNLGFYIDIWYYLGRYWPVIFILIGLNQIFKYLRKKDE